MTAVSHPETPRCHITLTAEQGYEIQEGVLPSLTSETI